MSTRHFAFLTVSAVCLAILLSGCPRDQDVVDEKREQGRCPLGFFEAEGGRFCAPWIPEEPCPSGFMPRLGEDDCLPVGHLECAAGFEPDPSGWGCRDITPAEECRGATREALGSAFCLPIGDCGAPFPPDGASLIVNESFPADDPAQGRFQTVAAAIAAAVDGDVIAIGPGSYRESLRIEKSITLVGACAAEVTFRPPRSGATGIYIPTAVEVGLQGMTILGFTGGVMAQGGATVRAAGLVLESNLWMGVLSAGAGTSISIRDSVVRRTRADIEDPWGMGLAAYQGGALQLDSVTVTDSTGVGIYVTSPGSVARLQDTVVLRTSLDGENENNAGIYMQNRGRLEAERILLADNHSMGLVMYEAGTEAVISQAVVRDSRLDSEGINGMGIGVWQGAILSLVDATLVGNVTAALHVQNAEAELERVVLRSTGIPNLPIQFGASRLRRIGAGVVADRGARLSMRQSAVVESVVYGLLAADPGSEVSVDSSVFADTRGDVPRIWGSGIGVLDGARLEISGIASMGHDGLGLVTAAGHVEISDSVLLGHSSTAQPTEAAGFAAAEGSLVSASRVAIVGFQITGLLVHGAGTVCRFQESVISGTRTSDGEDDYGFNVGVIEDSVLHLVDTDILDGERTGLAFWGGAGTIEGGAILDNQIAINLERGTTVEEVAEVEGEVEERRLKVSSRTRFEGNETKLGASALPVPTAPIEAL